MDFLTASILQNRCSIFPYPKRAYPPGFIQSQNVHLFPSTIIQDLWSGPMVEATPADQNLLDVELPEGTLNKVKLYNKYNPIPRNEMTFETGKLVYRHY